MTQPIFLVVDLFCGAGGTSQGYSLAELDGSSIAKVFACVNHDPKAIMSHWLNHKEVKHFEEDIRTLDLTELVALTRKMRSIFPDAKLILWASLECTNFSKAKGGLSRDPDSRTLADHLPRYIKALDPDYIKIENVVEFMAWGPLNASGKPVNNKNGQDWLRWRSLIRSMGYFDDWKQLNSANFGAYTSRNRLFGIFAKDDLPIAWPEATHAKNPTAGMHGGLQKWMPVKDVLDFADEGESILYREKPLVDATLERIYAGLIKFVAKGDTSFLSKYYSGIPANKNNSVGEPSGAITTVDHHSLVKADFLVKYNSRDKDGRYVPPSTEDPSPVISTQNRLYLAQAVFLSKTYSGKPEGKNIPVDGPAGTITTFGGSHQLVRPEFLVHYYSGGGWTSGIDDPCPTVTAMDGKALVQPEYFLDKHYGSKSQNTGMDQPAGTIMPNDKHRLVEVEPFIMPTNYTNQPRSVNEPAPTITADRHHHYIVNHIWGGNVSGVDVPGPTIIARQDKTPLYLIRAEEGPVAVAIYDTDSPVMIRIKQFMAAFGLVDIKMRMLRVVELLKIQGFPADYSLFGSQADRKKFIGNSVHPRVVKTWCEALGVRLIEQNQKVA